MALYKRKELCDSLGISQAVITMAVNRNHIVLTDAGYLDDTVPINAAWIAKKLNGGAMPASSTQPSAKVEREPAPEKLNRSAAQNENFQLQQLRTKVQIKKTNEEYELAKLKKEKLLGENLPIDILRHILVNQLEAISNAFEIAAEEYLLKLTSELRLSREKQTKIKAVIIEATNRAKIQAAADTKKSLRKLQQEYSSSKGRGEHD